MSPDAIDWVAEAMFDWHETEPCRPRDIGNRVWANASPEDKRYFGSLAEIALRGAFGAGGIWYSRKLSEDYERDNSPPKYHAANVEALLSFYELSKTAGDPEDFVRWLANEYITARTQRDECLGIWESE